MAKEFNIARTRGTCVACQKEMQPGQEYFAVVRETGEELLREDYCLDCWPARQEELAAAAIGLWKAVIAQPQEKKKLFVNNEVLMGFFHRLEGNDNPDRLAFRFVLTLILMRKRLLSYEGTRKDDQGREFWTMKPRGTDSTHDVENPHLDEERISAVSQNLSEILEGDP